MGRKERKTDIDIKQNRKRDKKAEVTWIWLMDIGTIATVMHTHPQ